jgi:tetratricopeptide (TPR) repeat protein
MDAELQRQILELVPDLLRPLFEKLSPLAFFGVLAGAALFFLWTTVAVLKHVFGSRGDRDDAVEERAAAAPFRAHREPDSFRMREPLLEAREQRADTFEREAPVEPHDPEPLTVARFEEALQNGDRAGTAGDWTAALTLYRSALIAARSLALSNPDSAPVQRRVAKALLKSGDATLRLGDAAGARQLHEQAMALLRRLYATQPHDVALAREYAVTLERIGSASVAAGDKTAARQAFEEELRVVASIAHAQPHDPQWGRFRAVIHVLLGNLREYDSRSHYEQAHLLFDGLHRAGVIHQDDIRTLTQLRSVLVA